MVFSTFLKTNIESLGVTPKQKIKQDFIHYKQVLNWSGKSDLIYENLIDNIIWILETKYAKFNLRYTSSLVAYNELNIILSQQLPQWLFIQKKQALENLDTFADLNNWGSVVKDRITRAINGNESGSSLSSYVPIDNVNADPYEKNGTEKRAYSNDEVDETKQTVDYLYWFSRMKWQTASIDLNTILKPYLGLFILVANTDLATPIKEDQFETLQNQIVSTNDRIDQVVTAVDDEIERVDSKIDREVRRVDSKIDREVGRVDREVERVDRDISSIRSDIASHDLNNVARRNTENTFTNQNVFEQRVFFNGEVITQSVELEQPPTNPNHAIPLGTAEALVNEAKDELNNFIGSVSNNTIQNADAIAALESKSVKTMTINFSQLRLIQEIDKGNRTRFQNYNYQLPITYSRVVAVVPIINGGTTPEKMICSPKVFTNNWIELVCVHYDISIRFNIGGHLKILYI